MKKTKIHRITLLVVDHDDLDAKGVTENIENTNYPNDCISPQVLAVETREVEWSDDHPLNKHRTQATAVAELFAARASS